MKKLSLAIALALILSIFVACSNDKTAPKAEEKQSTTETKEDVKTEEKNEDKKEEKTEEKEVAKSTEPLKVAMLGKDVKVATVIIAQSMGYFEEEGVNVQFEKAGNLSDAITALSMDKLDVLPFGAIPSASFISQGTDVMIFGGTISEGSEGLSNSDEKVTDLAQFEGKKIGSFRMETGHMILKGLLREAGVNAEFIYLESAQAIAEAVKKGEVDYGMVNSGYGYVAKKNDLNVAFHVGDFEKAFPCCRQSASPNAYKNRRDDLVKFETALLRAYNLFLNDHDMTINILSEYSGQDQDYIKAIFYGTDDYKPAMTVSLDPNKNKMIDFYEVMKANGDIDANTPAKIEDHIDTSIYEEALNILIERGENKDLYEKLLQESKENNK